MPLQIYVVQKQSMLCADDMQSEPQKSGKIEELGDLKFFCLLGRASSGGTNRGEGPSSMRHRRVFLNTASILPPIFSGDVANQAISFDFAVCVLSEVLSGAVPRQSTHSVRAITSNP